MENKLTSTTSQQLTTASKIKVCGDTESGITQAIQYVLALLGTPKDKQPSKLEMQLIINWLKTYRKDMPVDEIRTAYDLALSGELKADLNTFGGTLSLKNIMSVLNEYKSYKTPKPEKPKEEPMINLDRAGAVFDILSKNPETMEHLKKIGEVKRSRPDLPPLPYQDIHQKWMAQFDKLKLRWAVKDTNCRFIKRYGLAIDIEGYFKYKAEQLYRVNEFLKDRF